MGSSYNVWSLGVYADPDYASGDDGAPCSVGSIKICDDSACSGETNLNSTKCSFAGTVAGWNNCTFTATSGRYVEVMGGKYESGTGCLDKDTGNGDEMVNLYEMKFCGA
jgi:hypothetical protein